MDQRTFYVSARGDDGNDGRSPEGPFASVFRARGAARELRAYAPGPVTILLRGGRHTLDHPLVLTTEDGGSRDAPVTWGAYPGETPILCGSRPLRGWRPWKNGIWTAELPEARDAYFTRQLFHRGTRMRRARYPKPDPSHPNPGATGWLLVEKAAYIHEVDDDGKTAVADMKLFPQEDFSQAFHYRAGDLPHDYAALQQMEVAVSPMMGWFTLHIPIAELDTRRRVIVLEHALPNYRRLPWTNDVIFSPRNRFYLANALEDLTEPGEWVLDRREGTVYFMPPGGEPIGDGDVTVPVTPTLVDIRMAEHIVVEGLTFSETLDAGDDRHREGMNGYGAMFAHQGNRYCGETVRLWDSSHCSLHGNRFLWCGANAVYVETDCLGVRIEHNEVAHAGCNGITVIGNEVRHPRNTRITDNDIHDCGEILNYCAGVFLGCSDGTTVAHNHIHHLPHHAVNLATNGFGRNLVEYNHIHDVTREINDTGAINCWMDDPGEGHPMLPRVARSGHVIRYNFIHDVRGLQVDEQGRITDTDATRCIYLDDGASNCVVFGNIMARCHCGMLLHCGMHNYVENNLFIDCVIGMNIGDGVSPRVGNQAVIGFPRGHHIERNVFWTREKRPVLYTIHKYEEALLHHCDGNLLWSTEPWRVPWSRRETPDAFVEIGLDAWRAHGYDLESIVADPGFADPAHDDYTLRSDSPLHALGFVRIPQERIGPRARG